MVWYGMVWYSTVQYSTVQYSTVQYVLRPLKIRTLKSSAVPKRSGRAQRPTLCRTYQPMDAGQPITYSTADPGQRLELAMWENHGVGPSAPSFIINNVSLRSN